MKERANMVQCKWGMLVAVTASVMPGIVRMRYANAYRSGALAVLGGRMPKECLWSMLVAVTANLDAW